MRKIIILQRFIQVATVIQRSIRMTNNQLADELIVTSDPKKVLEALNLYPDALIIAGSCFGMSGDIVDINHLAPHVRRQAPNSILFIYSSLDDQKPPQADGFIPKFIVAPHDLAQMILSLSSKDTAETLRQRFPFIESCVDAVETAP